MTNISEDSQKIKSIKEITDSRKELDDSIKSEISVAEQLENIIKKHPELTNQLTNMQLLEGTSTQPEIIYNKFTVSDKHKDSLQSVVDLSSELVKLSQKKKIDLNTLLRFIEMCYKLTEDK